MAVIEDVLDPIIENLLKKRGEERGCYRRNVEGETMRGHLVNVTDGEPQLCTAFSPLEFYIREDHNINRDEPLNMMIAGRDTVRLSIRQFHNLESYRLFPLSLDRVNSDIRVVHALPKASSVEKAKTRNPRLAWPQRPSHSLNR